jgi:putative membrane protein
VPLSWFYMGFAALLIADAIVAGRAWRRRTLWSIVLGTWFLVAWDLVLDPSMAAPNLQYIHFWIWHETGPYFGMPLRNLAGWFGTGLVFIAVGRLAWNESDAPRVRSALPYAVYAINIVWSMILSIAAGMWPTAIAALLLALLPAALVFSGESRSSA